MTEGPGDRQMRLGRPTEDHLFIEPEIVHRRRREPGSGKRRRWPAKKSGTPVRELKLEAAGVYQAAERKGKIVPDPDMYFVITFSETFRSPHVRRALKNLELEVVELAFDNAAKVRIPKTQYESFLSNLEKNAAYVQSIKESALRDKVEESLLKIINAKPEEHVRVHIEISSIGATNRSEIIVQQLSDYVRSQNLGWIEKAYLSERLLLLTGELTGKSVLEIAEDIDAINRINLASIVTLQSKSFFLTSLDDGRNPSITIEPLRTLPNSIETKDVTKLPRVCILDSGINRQHDLIRPYVVETFDFTVSSQDPCLDELGHGTMVAGVTIYAGDLSSPRPTSSVIAAKIFSGERFEGNIISYISMTAAKFKGKTRVFNLSFASDGPDPSLSRALDDLSFKEQVLFVTCAGNIRRPQIMDELHQGRRYPEYLGSYPIFFPGDCFNTVTVGSFADKDSNWIQRRRPSPFTRTSPLQWLVKPDTLAVGGNLNLEMQDGQIVGCNSNGCGVVSTSHIDSLTNEGVGTSYSCPIVASIVASLVDQYPGHSTAFYKALLVSSCERLTEDSQQPFDISIQGFGVPSRQYSLRSIFWRVNLCADSVFDLSDPTEIHRYRFLFPDEADQMRVTLCFDVEPLLGSKELPYDLSFRVHKAGTQFKTLVRPSEVVGKRNNIKQCTYLVKRGGKGSWTLELSPKVTPSLSATSDIARQLRYAVVITIISQQRDIYRKIRSSSQRSLLAKTDGTHNRKRAVTAH